MSKNSRKYLVVRKLKTRECSASRVHVCECACRFYRNSLSLRILHLPLNFVVPIEAKARVKKFEFAASY